MSPSRPSGESGRRTGLKILGSERSVRVRVPPRLISCGEFVFAANVALYLCSNSTAFDLSPHRFRSRVASASCLPAWWIPTFRVCRVRTTCTAALLPGCANQHTSMPCPIHVARITSRIDMSKLSYPSQHFKRSRPLSDARPSRRLLDTAPTRYCRRAVRTGHPPVDLIRPTRAAWPAPKNLRAWSCLESARGRRQCLAVGAS